MKQNVDFNWFLKTHCQNVKLEVNGIVSKNEIISSRKDGKPRSHYTDREQDTRGQREVRAHEKVRKPKSWKKEIT